MTETRMYPYMSVNRWRPQPRGLMQNWWLTIDQCQEIIDLYYRQQGKPTEAMLLETLAKKVYGVKIADNADAAAMKAADVGEVPEAISDEPEAESTAEESAGSESIE